VSKIRRSLFTNLAIYIRMEYACIIWYFSASERINSLSKETNGSAYNPALTYARAGLTRFRVLSLHDRNKMNTY